MGTTGPVPILDTYGAGIGAAYSVSRKLKTGAAYAFRLIDGNGTFYNIGFDVAGVVDFAAINAIAGQKFLRTLYDQSGNSKDATIATNNIEIITTTLINTRLVAPIGQDNELIIPSTLAAKSVFYCAKANTVRLVNYVLWDNTASKGLGIAATSGSLGTFVFGGGANAFGNASNNTNAKVITNLLAGATQYIYTNGGAPSASATNAAFTNVTADRIGRASGSFSIDGLLGEVFIYTTDKAADYSAISSNIQTFYGL